LKNFVEFFWGNGICLGMERVNNCITLDF